MERRQDYEDFMVYTCGTVFSDDGKYGRILCRQRNGNKEFNHNGKGDYNDAEGAIRRRMLLVHGKAV